MRHPALITNNSHSGTEVNTSPYSTQIQRQRLQHKQQRDISRCPLCQIYGQPDISLDLWGSSSSQTDAVTQTLIFFFDCSTIYEATSRYYSQPLTILQSSFLTIELILKLIIPFSWVFVLTAFKNVVVKPILKSTVLDALDLNNWHFSQCWMWTSAWPLTQT